MSFTTITMRRRFAWVFAVGAAALSCSTSDATGPGGGPPGGDGGQGGTPTEPVDPAPAVTMPVEVLGPAETTETVMLNIERPDRAVYLHLRVHGLAYEGAASLRWNDGDFTPLANEHITFPDNQYGGQGGGYHTLRFRLPVAAFPDFDSSRTEQALSFRFNGTDGENIGFRVLRIDVRDEAGASLLPAGTFQSDDPDRWAPPIDTPEAIAEGQQLWNEAAIKDRPGGKDITATCAGCHAAGGEDLEYFAYSNRSIVQRSIFHELSEEQGQRIASYIRSLREARGIERLGRPYNPPYQPGPGLEGKDVAYWAAGAGIEAVADSEAATLEAMFPEGTGADALARVVDHEAVMDITKIPLAIQFPDWNEWLPDVHPRDVWQGTYFEDSAAYAHYRSLFDDVKDDPSAVFEANNFDKRFREFQENFRAFIHEGSTVGNDWRTEDGPAIEAIKSEYKPGGSPEFAKEQLAKWIALRYWDMVKLSGWEDQARTLRPESEAWQWPMSSQAVHQVAPHIVADNINHFAGQDPLVGDYRSTVWYQLQLTLNSGEGLNEDKNYIVHPVDWPYQLRHLWELGERTPDARWEGARVFMSLIKMYQSQSNTRGTSSRGWVMRFVHPKFMMSTPRGETASHESVDAHDPGLSGRLRNALLLEFLRVVESYDASDWERQTPAHTTEVQKWARLDPVDAVPTEDIEGFPDTVVYSVSRMEHMNTLYRLLPIMEQTDGIECTTIRRLAEWAASIWPEGDWVERLQSSTCE
ncbi:MAG: hypothetical protein AAF928_03135 [Myxococcota bacterium]